MRMLPHMIFYYHQWIEYLKLHQITNFKKSLCKTLFYEGPKFWLFLKNPKISELRLKSGRNIAEAFSMA